MAKKPIKETIHAKGLDISIYTNDFENEYVSLTDIAKYRSTDPRITIHNWLRSRDIVVFLGRVLYQEVERRAWRYWNLNREIARLNYLKNAGRRKEFKEMLVQDFCTSCIFRYAPVVYRLQFQW